MYARGYGGHEGREAGQQLPRDYDGELLRGGSGAPMQSCECERGASQECETEHARPAGTEKEPAPCGGGSSGGLLGGLFSAEGSDTMLLILAFFLLQKQKGSEKKQGDDTLLLFLLILVLGG